MDEETATKSDLSSANYSSNELLALLSSFEGELQARDALIEILLEREQKQQLRQSSASSTLRTNSGTPPSTSALESLVRDSKLVAGVDASRCSSCANNLLSAAKLLQIQRDADQKMQKGLNQLTKRYEKYRKEIEEKHERLQNFNEEEEKYVKELEKEREELFSQLKTRQNEFDKLEEQKAQIEEKLCEQQEREKLLIVFLLEERAKLFDEVEKLKTANLVETPSSSSHAEMNSRNALEEENKRLQKQIGLLQSEKAILQKRLDFFLKDIQQQDEFQRQFHFLQPRGGGADKELIVIGNGAILPPFPSDKNATSRASNRIRNSSSFPQSFDNSVHQNKHHFVGRPPPPQPSPQLQHHQFSHKGAMSSPRTQIPRQFAASTTNHQQDCNNNSNRKNFTFPGHGTVIPLMAAQSTTVLTTRRPPQHPPPPVPRPDSHNSSNQQQLQQHQYRRPSVSGTTEQMKKQIAQSQHQQPQTVISRRSTSLPRRIISAANNSPPTKQHNQMLVQQQLPSPEYAQQHQHPSSNSFQRTPPPMTSTNFGNKNFF